MTGLSHKQIKTILIIFIVVTLVYGILNYFHLNIMEGNENMESKIKPEWDFDSLQKTMYNRLVSEFEKIDKAISGHLKSISVHMNEKSTQSKSLILTELSSVMLLYETKQKYLDDLPSLFQKNMSIPEQREDLLAIYNSLNESNIEVTNEKIIDVVNQYIETKKNTLLDDIKKMPNNKAINTVKSNMAGFGVYYNFMDQINEGINKYLSEEEKMRKSATNVGIKDTGLNISK